MKYKRSGYIQELKLDSGETLLVNILYDTELKLNKMEAAMWHSWSNNITISNNDLIKFKMLIPDDFDELDYMRNEHNESRFSAKKLGLTIAPTIDCNFACVYCYEDKKPGRMTKEVEEQIVSYVLRNIPNKKVMSLTWYGGEPLMCKSTIFYLTQAISDICKNNEVKLTANMVTNGYGLDKHVSEELSKICSWRSVQITIDGSPVDHDMKRPLRNGKQTFDRIYNNLIAASDYLPIVLRVNVDKLNWRHTVNLLEKLSSEIDPNKIRVSFSPVHPYGDGCRDIESKPEVDILDNKEFSKIETNLVDNAIRLGFKVPQGADKTSCRSCQAVSSHTVIIEPDGSLQKCWTEVGKQSTRIGHINEPINYSNPSASQWLSFDPTNISPCKECEVLPKCFGSCPQRHRDGRPMEMICASIKYRIKHELNSKHLSSTADKLYSSNCQENSNEFKIPLSKVKETLT